MTELTANPTANPTGETTANAQTVGFGQTPKASPPARAWAVILGLACLTLAGVAGYECWRVASHAPNQSLVQPAVDVMATPGLQPWMPYAGAAAIVLGLILIWAACAPRTTTHVRIASATASLWLRAVDIARLSSAVARRTPGVAAAQSRARCRPRGCSLDVTVSGDAADPQLPQRVTDAVSQALAGVEPAPDISVSVSKAPEVGEDV